MTTALYALPDGTPTIIPNDPPTTVTLATAGQQARLAFFGETFAASLITIEITNNAVGQVTVALLEPDGAVISSMTSSSSSFTLPGSYPSLFSWHLISISAAGANTGSLNVKVISEGIEGLQGQPTPAKRSARPK